jgi:hypothetical protein
MGGETASDKSQLEQYAVSAVATLLLAVASISGFKQPEITLWAVFLAGVFYTFIIRKHLFQSLRFRTPLTVGIIALLLFASVGVQIWLIIHRHEQTTPHLSRPTAVQAAPSSGPAITNARDGVANTGTIGTVTINSDGDIEAPRKRKTQPR